VSQRSCIQGPELAIFDDKSDTNRTLTNKKQKSNYPIAEFKGLYGDRSSFIEGGYLFSELLETRSIDFEWKITPHVHSGLFQVFFINEGSFDLYESGEKRTFSGPCLVLVPPTAVHGFDFNEQTKGRIISIADALLHDILSDTDFVVQMLNTLVCITHFSPMYSAEHIETSLERLHEELFTNETGKSIMLEAALKQLFVTFYRLWEKSKQGDSELDPVNLGYFEKFQRLTRQISAKQSVKALAAELAISTVHLNRICNKIAGRSAGQLMNERLLDESKNYLSYTSYSVSEIAYLLKFDYPNYFARFFRKHTGLSPSEFRRKG
jgi:AraC family transcriptional activator of pobA